MTALLARLLAKFRRFRSDDDLKEELRIHREMEEEDYAAAGASVEQARRHARLSAGSPDAVVENIRDHELFTVFESGYRDVKLGLRALRRNPVFYTAAILTLGIGIGANAAVFTVLHGLLLRSLPVAAPQELVRLGVVNEAEPRPAATLPYGAFAELRRRQQSFVDLSAWMASRVTLKDHDGTLQMHEAELVSGNGFDLLGARAHIGRLIRPADDAPGGPRKAGPSS